jgi:hypothetical protein
MFQFHYKLKVSQRVKAKCKRHPRYNPEREGRGGIKGGCSTCFSLFDLHQARLSPDVAHREFLRRASRWTRVPRPRTKSQSVEQNGPSLQDTSIKGPFAQDVIKGSRGPRWRACCQTPTFSALHSNDAGDCASGIPYGFGRVTFRCPSSARLLQREDSGTFADRGHLRQHSSAHSSMSGGQPVTLAFSRKIGGIMAEYGEDDSVSPLSSFRYYM